MPTLFLKTLKFFYTKNCYKNFLCKHTVCENQKILAFIFSTSCSLLCLWFNWKNILLLFLLKRLLTLIMSLKVCYKMFVFSFNFKHRTFMFLMVFFFISNPSRKFNYKQKLYKFFEKRKLKYIKLSSGNFRS